MKTYLIDFWYYDDYYLKRLTEKFNENFGNFNIGLWISFIFANCSKIETLFIFLGLDIFFLFWYFDKKELVVDFVEALMLKIY